MVTFLSAITMGIMAALAVLSSFYLALPTWVLFIAWTSYYLFESNIKSSVVVFIQQILGILIAILIQYGSTALSEPLGFPIVVFLVMSMVFYISKLKYLNNIPAYFLGMIVWFGSQTQPNVNTILLLSVTLALGFLFAMLNSMISQDIKENIKEIS